MTTIGHGKQEDFSYDKKKVSANVNQQIETIKKEGKKIAGSADEVAAFLKLSEELAANGANKHEQNLVKGLIVEYQTKAEQENMQAAQKKQKAEVTPAAREAVKNIKKMIPDKKELDEPEARMLLDLINNTRGDYNAADIEYFKQELIKAGFGDLLTNVGFGAETKPSDGAVAEEKNVYPPTPPAPQDEEVIADEENVKEQPKKDVPNEPIEKEIPYSPKTPKKPSDKKPVTFSPKPQKTPPATQNKPKNGLRFKAEDVPNRAHLIIEASEGFGTDEEKFIDNVTVGKSRSKDGSKVADKYLHGRQPFNAAEAKAIDTQLRNTTGKGLLQYMSEEFTIGGGDGDDQFITQLYRQYITYGLKQE